MAIKVNPECVNHAMSLAKAGSVDYGVWDADKITRDEKAKNKFLGVDTDFKPDTVAYWKYPIITNGDKLSRKGLGDAQGYAQKNGETDIVEAAKKIAGAIPDSEQRCSDTDRDLSTECTPAMGRAAPLHEVRYHTGELRMDGGTPGCPPHVSGYCAVFNSMSDPIPLPGQPNKRFKEVIRKGAFTRCLANNPDVSLVTQHNSLPLANTRSGTLVLTEDDRGLRFDADLDPTDPDVQALIPKMKRKDLRGSSFGFTTVKDQWRSEGEMAVRELHDVDVFDASLVTRGAYPAAGAAIRSYTQWQQEVADQSEIERSRRADLDLRLRLAEID